MANYALSPQLIRYYGLGVVCDTEAQAVAHGNAK